MPNDELRAAIYEFAKWWEKYLDILEAARQEGHVIGASDAVIAHMVDLLPPDTSAEVRKTLLRLDSSILDNQSPKN